MILYLASQSPRRASLLRDCGIPFALAASETDETVSGSPEQRVQILSRRKALAALSALEKTQASPEPFVVLGADTLVALDGRSLGKPSSPENAKEMLRALSGRWHSVFTGVTLALPGGVTQTRFSETAVHLLPLSNREIETYVSTGEPMDKAGAYAIQGRAMPFVDAIRGEYSNVVGLPVSLMRQMLVEMQIPLETLSPNSIPPLRKDR